VDSYKTTTKKEKKGESGRASPMLPRKRGGPTKNSESDVGGKRLPIKLGKKENGSTKSNCKGGGKKGKTKEPNPHELGRSAGGGDVYALQKRREEEKKKPERPDFPSRTEEKGKGGAWGEIWWNPRRPITYVGGGNSVFRGERKRKRGAKESLWEGKRKGGGEPESPSSNHHGAAGKVTLS